MIEFPVNKDLVPISSLGRIQALNHQNALMTPFFICFPHKRSIDVYHQYVTRSAIANNLNIYFLTLRKDDYMLNYLRNIHPFKRLPPKVLMTIATSTTKRKLKPRVSLFKQHDQVTHMWIVIQGSLILSKTTKGKCYQRGKTTEEEKFCEEAISAARARDLSNIDNNWKPGGVSKPRNPSLRLRWNKWH